MKRAYSHHREDRVMSMQETPTFTVLPEDGTVIVDPPSLTVPKGSLVEWKFASGVGEGLLGKVVFPDASVMSPGEGLTLLPEQPVQSTASKSGQYAHSIVVWKQADPPKMAAAILIIEDP